MPTPEGLPTSTLHGQYLEPNSTGTPRQGTVTFTPTPEPIAFPDQNVIIIGTETATLDANGEFTITLISTDTAHQNPTGWTYSVTEKIIGEKPRTFNIFLPYSVGTVEMSDITPTDAAPTYLPVIGPQGPPGVIQTVNGKTGISITLIPSDIGAIASTEKGAASGVATLDSSSHLTASQYDWSATTPASVADAGAVGTSTKPARSDHVHAGVDLVNAQTVAGVKTFSSSPIAPTPTTNSQVAIKSYTDGVQTYTGVKTWTLTNPGDLAFKTILTGDTNPRFQLQGDGTQIWGPGNAPPDATQYRLGANNLASNSKYTVIRAAAGNPAFSTQVTGDTVDRLLVGADGTLSWGPGNAAVDSVISRLSANVLGTTDTGFRGVRTSSSNNSFSTRVTGDANNRWQITAAGSMSWGDGTASVDTTMGRESTGSIATTATGFRVYRAASTDYGLAIRVAGDTQDRLVIDATGKMTWGPGGSSVGDTTLYRSGSGVLQTDSQFATNNASIVVTRSANTNPSFRTLVTADTQDRFSIRADGRLTWGPGNASTDAIMYRNGVGEIKTDTNFTVAGDLKLQGGIFRNKASTTATTVANTTTETVIATMTIPANETQFAVYRLKAWGTIANAATTPNNQWKARIGGLTGQLMATCSFTFGVASSGTRTWSMELLVTILTTGVSGTWLGQMTGISNLNTNTTTNNTNAPVIQDGTTAQTQDTTIANALVITSTWGTATSGNTMTCYGYTAERVS